MKDLSKRFQVLRGLIFRFVYPRALPVGSEDGTYDVAVMQAGRGLQLGQGTAHAQDSVMVLTVQMDLRSLGPGRYAFGVRRVGSGWQEYPLRLD